jgi:hypothetical protein
MQRPGEPPFLKKKCYRSNMQNAEIRMHRIKPKKQYNLVSSYPYHVVLKPNMIETNTGPT